MHFTGYNCKVQSCVVYHCVREFGQCSQQVCYFTSSDRQQRCKDIPISSQLFSVKRHCTFAIGQKERNNRGTRAGNIDRHAFPHTMMYHNKKSLGPCGQRAWIFRPGPHAVQPVAISILYIRRMLYLKYVNGFFVGHSTLNA